MVRGLLEVVALSLAGAVVLRLLLLSPGLVNWVADDALPRLLGRLRRTPAPPPGRPIEEIATNLRRLGADYYGGHPGRSWVKSEALRRAYDETLVEGCHALEIGSDLLSLEPGTERDAERMRVEHLLTTAGLEIRRRPAA